MFLPFLKIRVSDIPQLLWAILTHGLEAILLPSPPPVSDKPTTETPVSANPEVPATTAPSEQPSTFPTETTEKPIPTPPKTPEVTTPQPPDTSSAPSEEPQAPPVSGILVEKPFARLFALIIGVDEYKFPDVNNLKGAVADANRMEEYLVKRLKVPSTRIKNLRNREATRTAIIEAISSLEHEDLIDKGDPILIYFAGHGGVAPTPRSWEAGGPEVQLLVPYDQHCTGKDGRKVTGVPDRTLGFILSSLADEKGDNITVILDCCHSGSGTRDDDNIMVRGIKIDSIPDDLDKAIWNEPSATLDSGSRASAIEAGFTHSGLRSHVLLAACGAKELSREVDAKGLFTTALLETLIGVGADRLTYQDLIQRMPSLPQQNPQCEGIYQYRTLFNAKVAGPSITLYEIREKDGAYEMDAGAAHGITEGAHFAVFKDRESSIHGQDEALGTLAARTPEPFTTILDPLPNAPKFALPSDGYALQIRAGVEEDLRLHIAMEKDFMPVYEQCAKEMQRTDRIRNILLVEKDKAELDISMENGKVTFNILNPVVTQFGLTKMPFTIKPDADYLMFIIRSAAHFYWHLRRKDPHGIFNNLVDVEFRQLVPSKTEIDRFLRPILKPTGPNLNVDNVIDVKLKQSTRFGLKIINKSEVDLYVSVFYFDNSSLEILSYFQPPTAKNGNVDPPLQRLNSLTIGYGAGGWPAPSLLLRDGQNLDVGFIKLFISTRYLSLEKIPQKSPFAGNRASEITEEKAPAMWGTILIPVVQRRAD